MFFRKIPTFCVAVWKYQLYWDAGSVLLLHDMTVYSVLQGLVRKCGYMACNFVTRTCADCDYVRGTGRQAIIFCTASKQNCGGRKFKVNCEVATDMAGRLVTEGIAGIKSASRDDKHLSLGGDA